jgi:phospholipid/cholesterol/gamma-HCH transport system permease protein
MPPSITVERRGRDAIVHLRGDVEVPRARELYGALRSVCRRRDVGRVVVDFSETGRIDSSAVAAVTLVGQQLQRSGKALDLAQLDERHRAAFALVPHLAPEEAANPAPAPGVLERTGERFYELKDGAVSLLGMVAETTRQAAAVITRRKHLPRESIVGQMTRMGVEAVFIVSLLSFLIGMTTGFQGASQLQKFGAGVFVADMLGLTMVRELAPLMTAVILTGRTGAAIAAELGTMRVRGELDALTAMGINPARFLIVPRLAAITVVVPALTLIAIFVGMLGGMLVATATLEIPPGAFFSRISDRVTLWDFAHGLAKSVVFAWIIGLAGCYLGLHTGHDASSVGKATTRAVVTSIFAIIIVDAVFATVALLTRMQ